jgi:transglutaminase-like putative cysteine protease
VRTQWQAGAGVSLLSLSVTVALSRLIEHGIRPGIIVPFAVAVAVADGVVWLAMRRGIPMLLAMLGGAVVAVAVLVVWVDPSIINPASSHFANVTFLRGQARAAHAALSSGGTPLAALPGVVVVIGALAALVAAATRAIWQGQVARARGGTVTQLTGCVAPSFGAFVYSTLVSADQGRLAAALTYFAGVALCIALVDRSPSPRTRRVRWRIPLGTVLGATLALAVVGVVGTSLTGMRLSVFHVSTPGGPRPAGTALVSGTALVDNLRAVEVHESNVVILHATSALPTYWQVATLDSFNGTAWEANPAEVAALAGKSQVDAQALETASPPVPTNGTNFAASVQINDFASRLLPSPPHTVAVSGLEASPVGTTGVLAAATSDPQTSYGVTAQLVPTHPSSASPLAADDPRLAPYLALPTQPAIVSFLAHDAVEGATSQGAEVQDLVNWFRSGRFRYTLDPPATSGSDPLVQFLTVTRAGYCQQFAGAFGILARSLGIPTRLVVGFTTGTPEGNGRYTVTGADAHVWPQVYLGPGTGWVSVEPTPPARGVSSVPANVVEPTTSSSPTTPASTATTAPTTVPTSGASATPTTTPPPSSHSGTSSPKGHGQGGFPVLLIVLLVLLAALVGAALWWRRWTRRDERADQGPPEQRIVGAWNRAQRALSRRGLGRRPAESPGEYATRLDGLERSAAAGIGAQAMSHLAALVEAACYGPRPCTAAEAEAALSWSASVLAANRRR